MEVKAMSKTYGYSEEMLTHYTCKRAGQSFNIDGNLDKYPWETAPQSPPFVDLVTGAAAFLETRCAAVWDDENLYIAFRIQEPDIRAEMSERDARVYLENDVEVFIAGQDCYYEFQVNALGTVYEVFYIWQDAYTKGSRFDTPDFDLLKRNVDVLGGFQDSRYEKHPRGKRWAFMDWDFPGLQTAVKLDGTLNDPSHVDNGWSVELAFPWTGMHSLLGPWALPVKEGDTLRIDFSRFEKLSFNGHTPAVHPGWALNAHGVYDSHIPECFSYVHLSSEEIQKQ
jgi:hypothetical protein